MIREPSDDGLFSRIGVTIYVMAIAGCFLIIAALIGALYRSNRPEPVGEARVQERYKNLRELREAEAKLLTQYVWQDKAKEIVRVPIDRAMELTVQEWQDPMAAKSNLIARVAKATAPGPRPPEQPNKYE